MTLFDTADVYGTGHSETVLARALDGRRDDVAIATKFGNTFAEGTGRMLGPDASPGLHPARVRGVAAPPPAPTASTSTSATSVTSSPRSPTRSPATLEQLRDEGLIRAYGWSLDEAERASRVGRPRRLRGRAAPPQRARGRARHGRPVRARGAREHQPRAAGHGPAERQVQRRSRLPRNDVRGSGADWLTAFDADGRPRGEFLDRLAAIRESLTADGRTLVQGALGWIWARSDRTIPIPGFKTVAQAEENAGALAFGPLPADRMQEIEALTAAAAR